MVSLLEPPLSSLDNTFIFKGASWLGRKHDGYPLLSFKDYIRVHPKISTLLGHVCVAKLQYVLTFNLLEAMMEVKILESMALQIIDNTNGNITWCS
jgi:hypothetical protein